jgi:hypothetical protein
LEGGGKIYEFSLDSCTNDPGCSFLILEESMGSIRSAYDIGKKLELEIAFPFQAIIKKVTIPKNRKSDLK